MTVMRLRGRSAITAPLNEHELRWLRKQVRYLLGMRATAPVSNENVPIRRVRELRDLAATFVED